VTKRVRTEELNNYYITDMPTYIFQHPETEETIEIVQKINDLHQHTDEDGTEWNRVFTVPNTAVDTSVDPFNSEDFVKKTGQDCGTMGELWDRSKELSEMRKEKLGHDPVKEKYLERYSKKRHGLKHTEEIKENRKKFSDD